MTTTEVHVCDKAVAVYHEGFLIAWDPLTPLTRVNTLSGTCAAFWVVDDSFMLGGNKPAKTLQERDVYHQKRMYAKDNIGKLSKIVADTQKTIDELKRVQ